MRVLSPFFVEKWQGRLINIHPSLLPEFKGANAVLDALKSGVKVSGCTTHFVSVEVDAGEIIMQSQVDISSNDDFNSLAQKILIEEHKIYPQTLKKICQKI
jgi:phosphoribosylglycinamide formyltransferase-1